MRKLKPDIPEWMVAQKEERRREGTNPKEQQFHRWTKPLIEDLKKEANIEVFSVFDFVNTRESYPEAIPTLLKHLTLPYHLNIKDGIIRALAVPEARGIACQPLLDEFKRLPYYDYTPFPKKEPVLRNRRWAIGLAFSVVATKPYIPQILEILRDKANEGAYWGFIIALRKLEAIEAKPLLIEFLDKGDFSEKEEAAKTLRSKAFRDTIPTRNDEPTYVFDRASWHYDAADFPEDLPCEAGATHMGYYLCWLIHQDLLSDFHHQYHKADMTMVKLRKMKGTKYLFKNCAEALTNEDLNELGCQFTNYYYREDPEKEARLNEGLVQIKKELGDIPPEFVTKMREKLGCEGTIFYTDYANTLCQKVDFREVRENWRNYDKIAKVITAAFEEWKTQIKDTNS